MGKYIFTHWWVKKLTWTYVKGLGYALAKGFVRGFVVGILSTIPKAWQFGLVGGTLNLLAKIIDGSVKSVGSGISAFMNGWTMGVAIKALSRLLSILFENKKWSTNKKYLIEYATSTLVGFGITRWLRW